MNSDNYTITFVNSALTVRPSDSYNSALTSAYGSGMGETGGTGGNGFGGDGFGGGFQGDFDGSSGGGDLFTVEGDDSEQ